MTCARCRFWKPRSFDHGTCFLWQVWTAREEVWPCYQARTIDQ